MRRPIAAALVALALACQSEEERRNEHLARANAYFETEQWGEAKIEFLNLIQLDPQNGEAYYKLGDTLVKLGDGRAVSQYREAVRLEPDKLEWRLRLATLLLAARRSDQALEQVDAVLERDAEYVNALVLRARIRGRQAEFDAMLADLDRALEIDPESTSALLFRAQALARLERWDEAEAVYRRLVEVQPASGSYTLLALFLAGRERLDEAERFYREAVEVAANPAEKKNSRLAAANFYRAAGRNEESERELLAARAEDPDDTDMLLALARFYVSTGDREKAIEMLEARAAAEPDDPSHLLNLARFHQTGDDRTRVMEALDRALALDPNYEDARLLRAEFLIQGRDDPEAQEEGRAVIEAVLEANPGSVRGMFSKAKLSILDAKYEEASILLRRVIEERPNAITHFLLGTTYLAMKQDDLARGDFLRALQLEPTYVPARTQLAALYLRNGNRELATQEARRGLVHKPGDPRLSLILAEALIGLREVDGAKATLDGLDLGSSEMPRGQRLQAVTSYLKLGEVARARAIVAALLEEKPDDPFALGRAVLVEAQAAEPMNALPLLDAALEASPDDPELYRIRAGFYLGFRRQPGGDLMFPSEAQADILTALHQEPDSDKTHVLLGKLRERMGSSAQAISAYERAIELDPHSTEAYLRVAMLYEQEKQLELAQQTYTALLDLPDRSGVSEQELAVAMNNLAWLLADGADPGAEELDRALELAQEAKELLPADPNVADTLGWVMHKRGIPRGAITLFREALASYAANGPASALTHYHLALSYEATGDRERAIEALRLSLGGEASFSGREAAEAMLKRLEAT